MFVSNKSLFFTLFFALTLLISFAPAADANGGALVHRRQANRMLKKRASASDSTNPAGNLIGVGNDPNQVSGTSDSTSATASATGSAAESATDKTTATKETTSITSGSTTSTTASTTSTTSLSTTSLSSTSSSTASNSTTSSSTTSSTPSSSHTPTSTTSTPATTSTPTTSTEPTVTNVQETLTVTNSLASATPSQSIDDVSGATSKGIGKATLTIIIVIASCVVGAIVIWTVIRKWKFSPSQQFEERINWEPTVDHHDDSIPGLHRAMSNASHTSFTSGSNHDGIGGARGYGSYGSTSDHGHSAGGLVSDLPAHDFTAGPSHLAPVGGYADLSRGPSPPMQEPLARGPSINRNYGYDTYGPRY